MSRKLVAAVGPSDDPGAEGRDPHPEEVVGEGGPEAGGEPPGAGEDEEALVNELTPGDPDHHDDDVAVLRAAQHRQPHSACNHLAVRASVWAPWPLHDSNQKETAQALYFIVENISSTLLFLGIYPF